ncbi:flavin reductase family protein [Rhodococcoides fascians]|uniref:flavin reductase family protein n=1 Tax=Rhodococcoides fascians TaxID=1828 RepID=UPI001E5B126F|nr:iron-sulfur cluster-binding domain-containing protein [Rhodococcus fascians]
MAFVDDITLIPSGDVSIVPEDEMGRLDIDDVLKDWDASEAIYCCGPEPLIAAVEQACARIGASKSLNVERFGADPSTVVQAVQEGDREFVVELRQTATTLVVPSDQTLLEVIRQVRKDMPFSCEEGFCGSCETRVLEGIPDHRDTLLTDEEKEEGDTMMVCVGRSLTDRLVLEL